jgi:ATP-dependent helicase/nuclease subunit B
MAQGEFRRRVRALERALLRGPRRAGGLAGLAADLRAWPEQLTWHAPVGSTELADWLDQLLKAAERFYALLARGSAQLVRPLGGAPRLRGVAGLGR